MTTYIAFLRGINVGGKNKIKMADLKTMFEQIGCSEVQTYIQSGNVIFESNETEKQLQDRVEQEIEKMFGITTSVILRTAQELEKILNSCPFSESDVKEAEESCEGESLYVSLMQEIPPQESFEKLKATPNIDDKYELVDRDVYLLFKRSIRNSKLANNLQKLEVPATVRNWNTLNKIVSLIK